MAITRHQSDAGAHQMMNDEMRAHAHALLNNSANTAATDPSRLFTRATSEFTQTTLSKVRNAGDAGDDESQIFACATILDELAARIAASGAHGAPVTVVTRELVLEELRSRMPRDGTNQADLSVALIDFTIYLRDRLSPEYSSIVARLYSIHDRIHTGTAAECYASMLGASAAVINDLITQLGALMNTPAADVRHSIHDFIRSQPSPARV